MKREATLGGVGALAFGILTFVALLLANPPGGTYSGQDVADFLARGHRAAVIIAVYVLALAITGLLLMLSRLRSTIAGSRASTFWALAVASAACWIAGFAIVIAPSTALAFSGGKLTTLSGPLVYTVCEAGWAVAYGGGGILLGLALVIYALGPVAAPAWVRWTTLVAGIAALASIAWFPQFLVYLWAIAIGVWTLVASRSTARETAATPQTA